MIRFTQDDGDDVFDCVISYQIPKVKLFY